MISTERNELATLPIGFIPRFDQTATVSAMTRCRGMTAEWSCDRRHRCERYRLVKFLSIPGARIDRLCYSGFSFFAESAEAECADEF